MANQLALRALSFADPSTNIQRFVLLGMKIPFSAVLAWGGGELKLLREPTELRIDVCLRYASVMASCDGTGPQHCWAKATASCAGLVVGDWRGNVPPPKAENYTNKKHGVAHRCQLN